MKKLCLLISCFIPLLFSSFGLADNTSEEDAYLAEYKARYNAAYKRMVENGEVESCTKEGGKVVPAGMMRMPFCITPYADGGKACKNSSECEGSCLSVTSVDEGVPVEGRCDVSDNPFGCYGFVENGLSTGRWSCSD